LLLGALGVGEDGVVEGFRDGVRGLITVVADYLLEAGRAEFFGLEIFPFDKTIGDEKEEVAYFQVEWCGRSRSKFGEDAKRNTLRVDLRKCVLRGGVIEQRAVTSGKNFQIAGSGFARDTNKSDKAAGIEIAGDGIVDGGKRAEEGEVGAEIGARVGPANAGEHGGTNPMAGNIAESDDEAAVRKSLPIVIVTTGFVGGLIPTGDGVALNLRRILGEQGLLNITGEAEIVLNAV